MATAIRQLAANGVNVCADTLTKDKEQNMLNNNNNNEESKNREAQTDPGKQDSEKQNYELQNAVLDSISGFYNGAVVLLTGGTGFVGKAILEKLLRSCSGVRAIYVLMRPKRGLTVEQRFKELVKNGVFDRVRAKNPEQLDKLQMLAGDVSQPALGLDEASLARLRSSVHVVIHSAATVKFTETLGDAITLNTLGSKRLMELCKSFRYLKSIVHVSTAYSNATQSEVEESVYAPPHDPDTLIQCVKAMPKETLDLIADRLQGDHPNTYTLTKAMAESVLVQYASELPICIVRPSIVTAAYQEPFPGWIDNIYGVTGIVMEISRGTYRSGFCKEWLVMDIVPVDMVVNTCIVAGWRTAMQSSNTIEVYNCTSGQQNTLIWREFTQLCVKYARLNPTKYVMMYPNFAFTTSRLVNTFWELVLHLLPSFVYDTLLRAQGRKPIMMKIARRFKMAAVTGEYFANREWRFANGNLRRLMSLAASARDGAEFSFDMRSFTWDEYISIYLMGIRKYILKDGIESMPAARSKLNRLYWVYRMFQVATGYYLFRMICGRR